MQRRRVMLAAQQTNPYIIGTIKYWLSGKDAPINGKWIDRASGLGWEAPSTSDPITTLYLADEKCYFFNKSNDRLVISNMNTVNIDLGNHWRIVFDIDYIRPSNIQRNLRSMLWDFGSLTNAAKAFGLFLNNDEIAINWKMQGNNSNPGLTINDSSILPVGQDVWQRLKGYYEIVDGGDGYDRFAACVNGIRIVCPVRVPKVRYEPTWNNSGNIIANGVTNNGGAINYHAYVKIRDLMVCIID